MPLHRRFAALSIPGILAAIFTFGPLLTPALTAAGVPPRPNVIFILADDLGWNDVGWNGSEIATPNLDRLAAAGTKLNRHYVYPSCSPTRVALLSGRYPSRFGVLTPLGSTTEMKGPDAILPQTLRTLGYRTHISGKWHIGETPEHRPRQYGFDTSYGYLRGQIDPYTHRYKFGDHITWHRNDSFMEENGHVTDLITNEAIRIVQETGDKPFFLYLAHHSPHYPLNEPPKWIAPYETTIDDHWRRHYAAAVTHMDAEIGRLMETVAAAGLAENTLLIFSSDNGGQESWSAPAREYNGRYAAHTTLGDNRPLRGWKTELYEGGIRVPAFAHWPGVLAGGDLIETPTHICDWAPTLIRLGGGTPGENGQLDGHDISSLLFDDNTSPPDAALSERTLYWRSNHGTAIRDGKWKLILGKDGDRAELFDLTADPNETENLAKAHPDIVATLSGKIDTIRARDLAP